MMTRSSARIRNAAQNSKASDKILTEKYRNDYKENKPTENIRTLEKEQTKQNPPWNLLHVSTSFRKRDKKDFPSNKKKKKARLLLHETKHVKFELGLEDPGNVSKSFVSFPSDFAKPHQNHLKIHRNLETTVCL